MNGDIASFWQISRTPKLLQGAFCHSRPHSSDHFHALRHHPPFHLNSHDAQPYRHVRHHRGKCVTQNCFHAPALMLSRHTQDLHSSPFRSREGTIGPDRANRIFRPRRESDVRASGLTVCLICPSLCIRKPAHVACVRRPSGPSGFPVREEVQYASLTVFRSPSKTRKKKTGFLRRGDLHGQAPGHRE